MIENVHKVIESTQESALEITLIESSLGSIFSLFFMKKKEDKEKELQKYKKLLTAREEINDTIDTAIEYHIAVANSLQSMKYGKKDKKFHALRLKSMKAMLDEDNYDFVTTSIAPTEKEEKDFVLPTSQSIEESKGVKKGFKRFSLRR